MRRCIGTIVENEPVAFYSKKLSKAESKYSTFDRELLAIFIGIKKFRHQVEGHKLIIMTDHKPLMTAINSKTDCSPRQTRHLEFIAQFTTDIRHISGKEYVVADALSRTDEVSAISFIGFDIDDLITLQNNDDELKSIMDNTH